MSDINSGLSQSIDENQATEQHVETEQHEETQLTVPMTTEQATEKYLALSSPKEKQSFLNTFSHTQEPTDFLWKSISYNDTIPDVILTAAAKAMLIQWGHVVTVLRDVQVRQKMRRANVIALMIYAKKIQQILRR